MSAPAQNENAESETQEVEDTEAQNELAEAQEAEDEYEKLDPRIRERLEKANREAAKYRRQVRELEPKAKAWDKAEAANKSELDKLKDDLTAREVELTELRVADVRRKAALNAGLDAEMAEFLTAADDVEALEQAQKLAKRLTPAQNQQPANRKTGDLRQGSRGENTATDVSRDDILRTWAGVTQ